MTQGGLILATFFIVDDEPFLHELYRDILELKGHKVVGEAYNGKECIEKLLKENPNPVKEPEFIIMDHRMPILNGLDTMKILLEKKPEMKIIFVSADVTVKDEAMAAGSAGFIKKPFNINTFFKYIGSLM
ncbi:MAG: response regulator [Thermoplasmata archaeon]|nr:MAG: response regulator [Thermoplasmata archaeon]